MDLKSVLAFATAEEAAAVWEALEEYVKNASESDEMSGDERARYAAACALLARMDVAALAVTP